MKPHRRPSFRVLPEIQAFSDQLRTLSDYFDRLTAPLKSLQRQQQELLELSKGFKADADVMERRVDAYDRRQFRRYKVEFGDWKGLLLAKANAALRRQAKGAPSLTMPTELDPLNQEQWREIVRMLDGRWQKYMATPMKHWAAALAHGRPKVQVSPQEARALAARKVSLAQKSRQLTKGDKLKAPRLRYAARKTGVHRKVEH